MDDGVRYLSSRAEMRAAALRVGGSVANINTLNPKGVTQVYPSAVYSKNTVQRVEPPVPPPAVIEEVERLEKELEKKERRKRKSGAWRRHKRQRRDRPNSRPSNAPLLVDYTGRTFGDTKILGCCKRKSPSRQNIWLVECECKQHFTMLEKDLKKLAPGARVVCKACRKKGG